MPCNRTIMPLRYCDQRGGELTDGAPSRLIFRAAPPSNARKKLCQIGHVLSAGLVTMVLLAVSQLGCKPPNSAPVEAVAPDFKGVQAKAESGAADAQYELGKLYAKGSGVKEDYKQAAKWYRSAANQGHAGAQLALGELYEAGQGVPHDDAEAAKYYRQSAEQGNATAQYGLAVLCVTGRGVPQDTPEALKWYRHAADQGDELAQYHLGMRYYEGKGVVADPIESYQWLSLVATKGMPDAIQSLADLKRKMTRAQITEGQRRAAAFVPKKPLPPAN